MLLSRRFKENVGLGELTKVIESSIFAKKENNLNLFLKTLSEYLSPAERLASDRRST